MTEDKSENSSNIPPETSVEELELQVDQTTTAFVEKLQRVEDRMRNTVQDVRGVVDATRDTIEGIKKSVDIKGRIVAHPIAMMAGSVALGALVGNLAGRSQQTRTRLPLLRDPVVMNGRFAIQQMPKPSFFDRIGDEFSDEIKMIRGMAIAAVLDFVKSRTKAKAPDLSEYMDDICESINGKVGYRSNRQGESGQGFGANGTGSGGQYH